MLERFELLFAIVGGWLVSILFLIVIRLQSLLWDNIFDGLESSSAKSLDEVMKGST
ncbi:MAG: hypothetical protein HWN80_17855 [Candidatus Lokiarchaeota archaeon]|nr:hypothetical protein [Candidatus Lokiarchaeota archaeon]